MRPALLVALVALGMPFGCGDDEGAAKPKGNTTAAKPAAGAAAANAKKTTKQLAPMLHAEERVSCPTPTTAKKCDPKTPACDTGEYCLTAGNGSFCGPCPEREGIRHAFKPNDFQAGIENRDPFQSFVVVQQGMTAEPDPTVARDPAQVCTKASQFQAPTYGVQELTLVGIVAQGTQRKVLLLDNTNYGYIVRKGDCVGKEKAVVKEIGANFVTFTLSPDPQNTNQQPVEISKQLYADPIALSMQGTAAEKAQGQNGPVIAPPPSVGPSAPAPTVGPNPSDAVPAPPP